jgi:hypothetical protein
VELMIYEYHLEEPDPEEARRIEEKKKAQKDKEAKMWEDEEQDQPSAVPTPVPNVHTQG